MSSSLALDHLASGKVRELYDAGDGRLLLVASDRISAFDVVLPTPIPDKGRVLTALSLHWFALTDDIVRNHVISARVGEFPEGARDPGLAGRALLVRRLEMLPLECVVRGYLAGSGWKDYRRTGAVCGIPLPDGLREADRLPRTLFTPSTKATSGHDENITPSRASSSSASSATARSSVPRSRSTSGRPPRRSSAGSSSPTRSSSSASTRDGSLVVGDEVLTPDSSRFWPADSYAPGSSPPSFDKQFVRDWLETQAWDKTPPGPELPDEVRDGTAARYREAYERLAGRPFASYLEEMGVRA